MSQIELGLGPIADNQPARLPLLLKPLVSVPA
jgi:hypothetical protein